MSEASGGSGSRYDVVVIGGGINGAGIARDAAERGLDVLLLEQDDFASGTTAWSSRLIHGGLRYLEYAEISLVYESLHERRHLLEAAPHLVHPLKLVIPVYRGGRRGRALIRAGMIAYDLLSLGKELPGHDMLSRRELLAEEPGIQAEGLRGAAAYYDAQVPWAERLVIENLVAAGRAGAELRNYCRVEALCDGTGVMDGVEYRDGITGERHRVHAPVVVNAGGPWVDRVLKGLPARLPRLMGGTKGSHIVVSPFEGAPSSAFYIEAEADGRPMFIIPWAGLYLIGTTDIRYSGDPSDARASAEEVDYLLAEANRVFPQAGLEWESVHYTYCGVRPLPWKEGPEGAITRKHIIREHDDVAKGLLSIIGGKLTTYRHLAEEVVDRIGRLLERDLPECPTDDEPLPGGAGFDEARERLAAAGIVAESTAAHLLSVYGSRALEIAEMAAAEPALGEVVCERTGAIAAEVVFSLEQEFACNLDDLLQRRMMIGLGPALGLDVLDAVAAIAGRHLGWSDGELEAEKSAYRQRLNRFQVPDRTF